MRYLLWAVVGAIVAWFLVLRRPVMEHEIRKAAGVQAALDAATFNGYTTYNTQLYTPPLFQPIVDFFKAGAYVPTSSSPANNISQDVSYSVQG